MVAYKFYKCVGLKVRFAVREGRVLLVGTFKMLLLFGFIINVAIGVTSYVVIAGTQTNWSEFVTYIWIFFWPIVVQLVLLYYRPIPELMMVSLAIIGVRMVRRSR